MISPDEIIEDDADDKMSVHSGHSSLNSPPNVADSDSGDSGIAGCGKIKEDKEEAIKKTWEMCENVSTNN